MGASNASPPSPSRRFSGPLLSVLAADLVSAVFSVTRTGARARRWAVILIGAILWAVYAFWQHPYQQGAEFARSFWDYPFRALFAADVFRLVLLGAFAFWAAYRWGAIFLDDVFEIGDLEVAKRFLRQAAFADRYGRIEIANGRVADRDQQSPIFLIGGPGLVRVNLENAALFEKIDGRARVVSPTVHPRSQEYRPRDDFAILEGFERLRTAINLRDQMVEMQVYGRTRDGIQITAEDVRVIFSVYRDDREPTLSRPYPFTEEALKTLVYSQAKLGQGTTEWTSTMDVLINQQLGSFISEHTLEEFLAAVGQPELNQRDQAHQELQELADQRAGTQALLTGVATGVPNAPDFSQRSEISDLFYGMSSFVEQARSQGVALRWVGVGTWKIPDEIIPEQHQTAWRISRENQLRGSEVSLLNLREESRLGELRTLVYDVPVGISRGMDRNDVSLKRDNMLALVHAYRGKLRSALDVYEREGEGETVEARRLHRALDHLAHVVYRYLGDSGNGA